MLRTNINTIEGERGRALHHNLFFSDGLFEKGTEAGRDVFFGEKYVELHHNRRSRRPTATAFRCSDSKSSSDSFRSSRSISTVAFGARPGRSRSRVLSALGQSAQAGQRYWRRPGASSEGKGMQDSCTPPMLSSPTLPSSPSQPVSPVPSAPCTTCGRRGASKKKKVWVHGLMQRVHPRLVGSSRKKDMVRCKESQGS